MEQTAVPKAGWIPHYDLFINERNAYTVRNPGLLISTVAGHGAAYLQGSLSSKMHTLFCLGWSLYPEGCLGQTAAQVFIRWFSCSWIWKAIICLLGQLLFGAWRGEFKKKESNVTYQHPQTNIHSLFIHSVVPPQEVINMYFLSSTSVFNNSQSHPSPAARKLKLLHHSVRTTRSCLWKLGPLC